MGPGNDFLSRPQTAPSFLAGESSSAHLPSGARRGDAEDGAVVNRSPTHVRLAGGGGMDQARKIGELEQQIENNRRHEAEVI